MIGKHVFHFFPKSFRYNIIDTFICKNCKFMRFVSNVKQNTIMQLGAVHAQLFKQYSSTFKAVALTNCFYMNSYFARCLILGAINRLYNF